MQSKIIRKLSVNYSHEIHVTQLEHDYTPNATEFTKALEKKYADLTQEERQVKINADIGQYLLKMTAISNILRFLMPYYEFDVDESELADYKLKLKAKYDKFDDQTLTKIAREFIEKELVFADITREFDLKLTQEQLNDLCNDYCKATGTDVTTFKNSPAYNDYVDMIKEKMVTDFLLMKFTVRVDLPYNFFTNSIDYFNPRCFVPYNSNN